MMALNLCMGEHVTLYSDLVTLTCLVKSPTMLCSDTWEPMAKRLFICFSMREIISWSSAEVKPSTPIKNTV